MKSTIGNVTTVYIGNYYEYTTQTSGISPISVTPLNYGVACQDNATGTGYLMYSKEDVFTRFAAHPPAGNNASHFICVKYDSGQWKYDTDTAYYTFIPEPSDVLVAAVNYDADTVTSLQGTNTVENGIAKGYASGNLTYTADWYNGAANDGEFTVGGTSFTPNALLAGKKYYYAGSTRIAMREGSNAPLWLLGDHLGSTSRVANYDGSAYTNGWQLYRPWGEKRYPSGASGLPTTYRFTGQRQESTLGGADGLYYYGARWYDSSLNRWNQPDTIVPEASQGTQAWDRMGYVNNNPVKHTDPTGHETCDADGYCGTLYPKEKRPRPKIGGGNSGNSTGADDFDTPDLNNIPNPEGYGDRYTKVWKYYDEIRKWLFLQFGNKYVSPNGKIDDVALMAMIIWGEFGDYKGVDSAAFGEALEAVSNQYHATDEQNYGLSNIQCGGSCTLETQLMWLTDVEAWYTGKIAAGVSNFQSYIADAQSAAGVFCTGSSCNSWMWGDVVSDDLVGGSNGYYYLVGSSYHRVVLDRTSSYPGRDTWIVWESPGVGSKVP